MKLSVVAPLWQDRPAAENLDVARHADRLGFPELWIGEMATFDVFALASVIASRTEQIGLVLGPLAVSVRTPVTMAMGVASVQELGGRRVDLALGASSLIVVEHWHGREWSRTATHLAETAQITRGLLRGDRIDFQGELARCRGYRLRLPATDSSITIAAFSPAAIRVAARHGDRMLLNMVSPASLRLQKQQLEQAADRAVKDRPRVAVWLPCAVDPDQGAYRQLLGAIVGYLAAPGYSDMFRAAGFDELVDFARTRPHPKDLLAATPPELLAAVGLVGSAAEVAERLEAYRSAGADEICLVPATAGDDGGRKTLEALAAWL